MTDRHQAVDLVTAAIWCAFQAHQLHLGVAAAVDGLMMAQRGGGVEVGQVTSGQVRRAADRDS